LGGGGGNGNDNMGDDNGAASAEALGDGGEVGGSADADADGKTQGAAESEESESDLDDAIGDPATREFLYESEPDIHDEPAHGPIIELKQLIMLRYPRDPVTNEMASITIRYGSDCSGAEAPVFAWRSVARVCEFYQLLKINIEHRFSSEHPKAYGCHKFLKQNACADIIFRDLHARTVEKGPALYYNAAAGIVEDEDGCVPVPQCDHYVAGFECKDVSAANRSKKELVLPEIGNGTTATRGRQNSGSGSGQARPSSAPPTCGHRVAAHLDGGDSEIGRSSLTLRDSLEYVKAHCPRTVYLENVSKCPLDRILQHVRSGCQDYHWVGFQTDSADMAGNMVRPRIYVVGALKEFSTNPDTVRVAAMACVCPRDAAKATRVLLKSSSPEVVARLESLARTVRGRARSGDNGLAATEGMAWRGEFLEVQRALRTQYKIKVSLPTDQERSLALSMYLKNPAQGLLDWAPLYPLREHAMTRLLPAALYAIRGEEATDTFCDVTEPISHDRLVCKDLLPTFLCTHRNHWFAFPGTFSSGSGRGGGGGGAAAAASSGDSSSGDAHPTKPEAAGQAGRASRFLLGVEQLMALGYPRGLDMRGISDAQGRHMSGNGMSLETLCCFHASFLVSVSSGR